MFQIFIKKKKKLLKNYKVFSKEFTPNENLKKFNQVNFLIENLIQNKFNRNDIIIAVDGGIIGDFTGFVASILKRGVNFINIFLPHCLHKSTLQLEEKLELIQKLEKI